MNFVKGVARRATQSMRGSGGEHTQEELDIEKTIRRVQCMEKTGVNLSDKILKVAKLMEELGQTMKDIGEGLKPVPDHPQEMQSLIDETVAMGDSMTAKAKEFQGLLKEQGFDLIGAFLKGIPKLREAEEDRKKKQLEYDFFKQKVNQLRKDPPKDTARIPRNEGILENWRIEVHKSTENLKVHLSALDAQGTQALDKSVLTSVMTVCNFAGYTSALGKQHMANAKLPMYSPEPCLPPTALPPNPLVPFYSPGGPGGVPANQGIPGVAPAPGAQPPAGQVYPSAQPTQLNYGYQQPGQQPAPHDPNQQQQQQPAWGAMPPGAPPGQAPAQQQQPAATAYPPQQQQPQTGYPQQQQQPQAQPGAQQYPTQQQQPGMLPPPQQPVAMPPHDPNAQQQQQQPQHQQPPPSHEQYHSPQPAHTQAAPETQHQPTAPVQEAPAQPAPAAATPPAQPADPNAQQQQHCEAAPLPPQI